MLPGGWSDDDDPVGGANDVDLVLYDEKRIAGALGGRITVQSEEGAGSTFTLWLPASSPESGGATTEEGRK